jgi:hypothetical protein
VNKYYAYRNNESSEAEVNTVETVGTKTYPVLKKIKKNLMYAALIVPVAFGINFLKSTSFASSSGPTCSGSDTIALLQRIVDENAMNTLRAVTPEATYDDKFIDIITTDKTDRQASCKFEIALTISGKNGVINKTWSEITGNQLTYTVEVTDDGRLYATVYGLK